MLKEISPRAVEHKFIVVSDQLEWTRKGLGCQYILSSITILGFISNYTIEEKSLEGKNSMSNSCKRGIILIITQL